MLVVRGHNSMGNVLHVIVGPESELYMDVHGAKVMDITPILQAMTANERVFLSVSRCKAEAFTEIQLKGSGAMFGTSFGNNEPGQPVAAGQAQTPSVPVPDPRDATANSPAGQPGATGIMVEMKRGRCEYCGKQNSALLPLSNIRICPECVTIELGRIKESERHELDSLEK